MHEVDKAIINACKKKDTRAEYALYRECYGILMTICRRYVHNNDDAVDLMNKGFLKILNNLHTYTEGKPFDKWIKSIMINTVIDEFRMNRKYKNTFTGTEEASLSRSSQPVEFNDAESKISVEEMLKVIQKLPDGAREVFNLFVFEGMNHGEISKTLLIPEGTSRWLLSNARGILKKQFASLVATMKVLAF